MFEDEDEAPDVNEQVGEATKAVKQFVTKGQKAIDETNKRLDRLETAFKRGTGFTTSAEPATAEQAEYKAAFEKFVRFGEDANLKSMQQKSMMAGSDVDGGYLIPDNLASRIITKLQEVAPIRRIASTITIGGSDIEFLLDNDDAGAAWADEIATRQPSKTPQLGKKRIVVHELTATPLATQKVLEDSVINLEDWLTNKIRTQFDQTEGRAFVGGDGVGKPRGFLTYPDGTTGETIRQVPSGSAGLTGDGLMKAVYSIKSGYRAEASWVMSRTSQLEVRKLKDENGQYLWRPGLAEGQPDRLLGFPIQECEDMPELAPGSLSIAFGAWRQAYQVVDRLGMTILRDPYSRKPFVEFATRKRVGGDVVNFEALVLVRTGA